MRKIPSNISVYIDESLERIMARFSEHMDERFKKFDRRFNEIDKRFNEVDTRFDEIDKRFNEVDTRFDEIDKRFNEMDKRFIEFHALIVKEFEHHTGAILNEFDASLKAMGEYIDTKTTPEEVRRIIHDEMGHRKRR